MEKVKKRKFKYLLEESYLAYIKNSVGTTMFKNFYVITESGVKKDVLQAGNLSCAVYLTTLLRSFGLIKKLHFTVGKTVEDMVKSGWKKISEKSIKPGDVLVWVSKPGSGGAHNHIGFYIGNKQAVSNDEIQRKVIKHHYLYKGKRRIEFAFRPNWKQQYAKS